MSDGTDDTQRVALTLVTVIVGVVVAGVVAFGAAHVTGGPANADAPAAGVALPAMASTSPQTSAAHLTFAPGSNALPADANDTLVPLSDAARADTATVVHIVAFHGLSGDIASQAAGAAQRAESVRHALEANGVQTFQLVVEAAVPLPPELAAREAGRVEMHLR